MGILSLGCEGPVDISQRIGSGTRFCLISSHWRRGGYPGASSFIEDLKYDSFRRAGVERAFKTMLDDERVAVLTCCDELGGDLFVHREFPVYPGIMARPALVHTHSLSKAASDIGKNDEVIRHGSGIPSEPED